ICAGDGRAESPQGGGVHASHHGELLRESHAGRAESIIEWGTDTTRTIASLVFSGTAARCQDMKIIFSHGGGTMPFLTERFVRLPLINKNLAARVPNGVEHELKRFYYDTAQASHPMALASLTK